MKLLLKLVGVLFLFSACGSESPLDRNYFPQRYDVDFTKLYNDTTINREEVNLIHYTVMRQRDYYNYSLEGKNFRDILEMAKTFRDKGLPVQEIFNKNGEQEFIRAEIENLGSTLVRKKTRKSRLEKNLKFTARLHNSSKQDVVLLGSTFTFKGLFGDYLTSAGYEINCKIPANSYAVLDFIINAKAIRRNLLVGRAVEPRYVGIDDLLPLLDIEMSGATVSTNTTHFSECRNTGSREPFDFILTSEDPNDPGYYKMQKEGDAVKIIRGNAHIPPVTSDEPVNIYK